MSAFAGTVLLVVVCLVVAAIGAWGSTTTRQRTKWPDHDRSDQ